MIEENQEDVPGPTGEAVEPESSRPTAVDWLRLVLVPFLFSLIAARLMLWGSMLTVLGVGLGAPAYLAVRRRTLREYPARPGFGSWITTLTDMPMTSYGKPQLRVVGAFSAALTLLVAGAVFSLTVYSQSQGR